MLQQFLVAAGTSLPSCCLATIRGYTNTPIDSALIRHGSRRKRHIRQFFYRCLCIRFCSDVFAELLPSNDRGIHRHTHRLCFDTARINSSIVVCVFCAAVTFLPSCCLARREGNTCEHRLTGGIYVLRRWDGLRCRDIRYIPNFIKTDSAIW
jgi:hypothetical protein